MPFIGIISDEKNENFIRKELLNHLGIKESLVLFIKEKSIDNIKNIKFETIILAREFKSIDKLKNILKDTKYLVINSDLTNSLQMLENLDLTVITYGFNSKATVTVSSVEEDKMILCIQRNIICENGKIVEPQEIEIKTTEQTNNMMAIIAVISIYKDSCKNENIIK